MGRAIYCQFPTCSNETALGHCTLHKAIQPVVEQVAEHLDPENILTRSVVYANLMPMIRLLEEQWREAERLRRQLHSTENELQRILGGT